MRITHPNCERIEIIGTWKNLESWESSENYCELVRNNLKYKMLIDL